MLQASPEAIERFISTVRTALADVLDPVAHLRDVKDIPVPVEGLPRFAKFPVAYELAIPGQLHTWEQSSKSTDPFGYASWLHRTYGPNTPFGVQFAVQLDGTIVWRIPA